MDYNYNVRGCMKKCVSIRGFELYIRLMAGGCLTRGARTLYFVVLESARRLHTVSTVHHSNVAMMEID